VEYHANGGGGLSTGLWMSPRIYRITYLLSSLRKLNVRCAGVLFLERLNPGNVHI